MSDGRAFKCVGGCNLLFLSFAEHTATIVLSPTLSPFGPLWVRSLVIGLAEGLYEDGTWFEE